MNFTLLRIDAPGDQAVTIDDERLMAELSIARVGRHFHYDGYRYEFLADAVAYAQLVHARLRSEQLQLLVAQPGGKPPTNDQRAALNRWEGEGGRTAAPAKAVVVH